MSASRPSACVTDAFMAISRERGCPRPDERGNLAVILRKGGTRDIEGAHILVMTVLSTGSARRPSYVPAPVGSASQRGPVLSNPWSSRKPNAGRA